MEKYFDISLPLNSGLPVWPGDPTAVIKQTSFIQHGAPFNSSRINASLHWGTHLDAPYHLNPNGWKIDEIPLICLIGKTLVIEITDVLRISEDHMQKFNLAGVERLLIKTRNSHFWRETPLKFHQDFTALTPGAAWLLVDSGLKLVGIDYLSLDCFDATELPVHRILYQENIVGLEGLDLGQIAAGWYEMFCLPLKIEGGDGAPARVILRNLTDD